MKNVMLIYNYPLRKILENKVNLKSDKKILIPIVQCGSASIEDKKVGLKSMKNDLIIIIMKNGILELKDVIIHPIVRSYFKFYYHPFLVKIAPENNSLALILTLYPQLSLSQKKKKSNNLPSLSLTLYKEDKSLILYKKINKTLILYKENKSLILYKEVISYVNPFNYNMVDLNRIIIIKTNHTHKLGIISYWTFDLTIKGEFRKLLFIRMHILWVVKLFWNDVIRALPAGRVIKLQIVGHSEEMEYWNVTPFVKTDKDSLEIMLKYYKNIISTLNEKYLNMKITGLTFKYFMYEEKTINTEKPQINKPKFSFNQQRGYSTKVLRNNNSEFDELLEKDWNFDITRKLPINNNYKSWGEWNRVNESFSSYTINIPNEDYFYKINYQSAEEVSITVCVGDKTKSIELFRVSDRIINSIENLFLRKYLNNNNVATNIEIYKENKLILKTKNVECNFIKKMKKIKNKKSKFLTIDLETAKIGEILTPVSISLYDGVKAWSYNITNFTDFKNMLTEAVKSIIRSKYDGCNIYLHNFSGFDSIFLLNILSNLTDNLKILKKGNDILNLFSIS